MQQDFQTLQFHIENQVAYIELNRPEVRNAMNLDMMNELTSVFELIRPQTQLRRIQLSGAGKCFCAGADFSWMKQGGQLTEQDNLKDSETLANLLKSLDELPQVVVTIVHGAVMGGGLGLLACCDEVIAHRDTKFRLPEVRLGLLPAIISPFVFSKIPYSQALALTLSARPFSCEEAMQFGLVHRIYTHETHEELMSDYAHNAPLASQVAKAYLKKEFKPQQDPELLSRAMTLLADLRQKHEAQEGLRAVLEKRSPPWKEGAS